MISSTTLNTPYYPSTHFWNQICLSYHCNKRYTHPAIHIRVLPSHDSLMLPILHSIYYSQHPHQCKPSNLQNSALFPVQLPICIPFTYGACTSCQKRKGPSTGRSMLMPVTLFMSIYCQLIAPQMLPVSLLHTLLPYQLLLHSPTNTLGHGWW